MSAEPDIQSADTDNWVFDSLVNFLHGSIWKAPVVGFIEEKSVVFDPDSYNNMTEEKEEEFRKIHEEYKAVVDFMLSSFMEDLQVTPEQVEEACRMRECQCKTLPESHVTKVALEQLWAAEDFTAFRRLMTRKNIDLQLQSLELLVAKYGILSPALRSGDSEEAVGDDGEDDFLQVVIRYSDQLEFFKCDYGAEERLPGCSSSSKSCEVSNKDSRCQIGDQEDNKNMKVHLAGIQFKSNLIPSQANFQEPLALTHPPSINQTSLAMTQESRSSTLNSLEDNSALIADLEELDKKNESISVGTTPVRNSPNSEATIPPIQDNESESYTSADENLKTVVATNERFINSEPELQEEPESQLIQLEEAEAVMEEVGITSEVQTADDTPIEKQNQHVSFAKEDNASRRLDEQTAVEIASTADEQRRILTAVRKALETNPEDSTVETSIDVPAPDNSEDIQKRRDYLRAQRDKLIAMKKHEREKLLSKNAEGEHSARPKSARAAQLAIRNPATMRAATLNEKSLSARRALADRLKQELIEK